LNRLKRSNITGFKISTPAESQHRQTELIQPLEQLGLMHLRGKHLLYRKKVKSGLLARKGIWDHGKNIFEMSELTLTRSRKDSRDKARLHS